MTELKTLKDLNLFSVENYSSMDADREDIFKETLKKEAIKWVLRLRKEYPLSSELNAGRGAIEFIKHFFNITEEDLK